MTMTYRNGTYIAFHADGVKEPTESDIKYYNLLKAWNIVDEQDFEFVNSHEKTSAVRDSSKKATLKAALTTRLRNSKNMILIIGDTTREDEDWVPFEIRYAVDECRIPIIAAYPACQYITAPSELSHLWPEALRVRISNGSARVIHVPFKQKPLGEAVSRFHVNNQPDGGLIVFTLQAYRNWGIVR